MQVMSWTELIVGLSIIIVVWYVYVILRYYRKDLSAIIKKRDTGSRPVKWERTTRLNNEETRLVTATPNTVVVTHAQVHELMEELKLIFRAAIHDQLNTEQIKEAIAIRLQKYQSLDNKIRIAVNQHIVNEFSLQLKLSVTTEEINSLWKS